MTVFLGSLGTLLGLMVMLAGALTFVRGLPTGVTLKPGRTDPRGKFGYLVGQEALGMGLVLLALDVILKLASRPFLVPGILLVSFPLALGVWRRIGRFREHERADQ